MKPAHSKPNLYPSTLFLFLCLLFQTSRTSPTQETSFRESSKSKLFSFTTLTENTTQRTQPTDITLNEELNSVNSQATDTGDSSKPLLQSTEVRLDDKETPATAIVESVTPVDTVLPEVGHTPDQNAYLVGGESSGYSQPENLLQSPPPSGPQRERCETAPPVMITRHSDGYGTIYPDRYTPSQPSCNANASIMERTDETIEWRYDFSDHFSSHYSWHVTAPEAFGFVVEFDHVDMKRDDYLEIFNTSALMRNFTGRKSAHFRPLSMRAPLFLGGKEMTITMNALDEWQYDETSNFKVRYKARLTEPLPETVYILDFTPAHSGVTFRCSGIRDVPDAIMCDGVKHCDNGKDEENCSYRQQGCGDWFPYNDHCLKAKFVALIMNRPGENFVTRPVRAAEYCQSEYGATLALLPDQLGINIAANMIQVAGFSNAVVGISKFRPVTWKLRHLYRYLWQWGERGSPIAYEQQDLQREGTTLDCGELQILPSPSLAPIQCINPYPHSGGFVCMKPNPSRPKRVPVKLTGISFPKARMIPDRFPTKECPDGSVVQVFHLCQWGQEDRITSAGWSPGGLPLFQCRLGHPVHYSLVCDGTGDCPDRSDELHCKQPQFYPLLESSFICRNFQIIPISKRCNGATDCFDESDEEHCVSCTNWNYLCPVHGCVDMGIAKYFTSCKFPFHVGHLPLISFSPGTVHLDGLGMSRLSNAFDECDEGYFRCTSGLCVPTFLINNGEKDCPDGQDEDIPAQNVTCPGYYRCQEIGLCVHNRFLCDNIYHCPNKDDELFCNMSCPSDQGCTCEGQAYTCSQMIDPLQHLHVRYLDFSHGSGIHLDNIHFMEYLSHLNLSFCYLSNVTLADMPHLLTLDLSYNHFTHLGSLNLTGLTGLLYLNLSSNPFVKTLNNAFTTLLLQAGMKNLRALIITNIGLEVIVEKPFSLLSDLEYLDVRGNMLVSYEQDSFSGLTSLEELHADESRLCCSYFHSSVPRCYAPEDELSSCSDLLAKDFLRVFLWILSVLAILGNAGVLVYRLFNSSTSSPVFCVLVKNLCASDLLMGVYMMMIGVADARLKGQYVAKESEWTSSVTCTLAGFLSFVSSEVSAFIICLITLDRVLVISFPLHTRLHVSRGLAISVCCLIWVLGLALAVVPILTGMEFYGQTGICVPLPITRQQFSGQSYAFSVFIVLNFVLFVFIGVGQLLIYHAVRRAGAAVGSERRQQDMAIARRLFLIVFTDFCCWFPIGVLGLLAASGTPISGSVNVWVAIFVLPLNSALNPFLYTLNGLLEQWKKRRAEQRIRRILGKLRTEIPKWQPASVKELIRICEQSKMVSGNSPAILTGPSTRAQTNNGNSPDCSTWL